ncbi:hypothetical protein NC652_010993 [Populus alba x Populus x berolinensis]|nr:hypothetical protein NC652_010993 [Populus alba x Populus x berolinensis]
MKRASIRTYFPDYKGYLGLIPKQIWLAMPFSMVINTRQRTDSQTN